MTRQPKDRNALFGLIALLAGALILGCFVLAVQNSGHHGDAEGPAKYAEKPKQAHWASDGYTGTFDRQSIQRGFQVYKEVCSSCHGLKRVAFRNLQEIGFSEAEVKTLAAEYTYATIDDEGEPAERAGKPSDRFPSPFANEEAARSANGGAYPPDLSLIVKARHDGQNYIHSLLTGYEEAPADFPLGEGMSYNPYFEGRQIAMAQPLSDGQMTYADGTEATLDQAARDVVAFLQWAAEPEMEARKRMGLKVMIFLALMTIFFYFAMKRVWANVKKK